ncbi:uncharacterized protein TRIVIDRAFT_221613 [Trichoderma virens Gv29-8]|uniref:Uncharacterized protein n=1 Tax=Hypocrea virens (strain Gv29-8 / FGSC 10586) TaxID=413071 RepID=G9MTD0_HYPVG|nr:uncharacterized protein TRIVIDRAFT_221613 [Trichoderma virens Gv29-8]EHK22330.1 hypothetical protein TRIVIDRAFT_221613 [Trichoderma virens Gv29-8]UKZ47369.1 hypothetical protein TrVGV298_001587 [Trichoderma virens]
MDENGGSRLEMLTHKPLLSNDDLVKLGVVRGAELIIDEENPIDLEPRFFNPGSAHEVAQGVRNYEETQKWARRYPEQETPINPWGYPEADMDDIKEFACDCWSLVDWRRRYSVRESRFTWKKNPNWDEPL